MLIEVEFPLVETSHWHSHHILDGGALWGLSYFICVDWTEGVSKVGPLEDWSGQSPRYKMEKKFSLDRARGWVSL